MNKIYTIFFILLAANNILFGQAKKPIIMVVPSDNWCVSNGFIFEYDNEGKKTRLPDYRRSLQESHELLLVISKINELIAERGFPLKNLESALKSLEQQASEDAMTTSSEGASLNESPIDKLKKTANADIIIQITWNVTTTGPKKSITFNMQGLDSYSDKQVAGASGTGQPSFSAEIPVLLQEAVLSHLDNFNAQLQSHFDDIFQNGREIVLNIKVWDSWEHNLETEDFGDQELRLIIEGWVSDNTVNGRFSLTISTENQMKFEQVRISLFIEENGKERAVYANRWANKLKKYLSTTYQIQSKPMTLGLGNAQLILGGK